MLHVLILNECMVRFWRKFLASSNHFACLSICHIYIYTYICICIHTHVYVYIHELEHKWIRFWRKFSTIQKLSTILSWSNLTAQFHGQTCVGLMWLCDWSNLMQTWRQFDTVIGQIHVKRDSMIGQMCWLFNQYCHFQNNWGSVSCFSTVSQ
jgi:hypothetical protein